MTYLFKWRRCFFWRSRRVSGHHYAPEQNKMVLYKPDGSIEEIVNWEKCAGRLGTDWVLFTKRQMEKQAGTNIQLNVDADK